MIVPRPLKKVREKITPFSQEDKIPTFNLGSGTADSTTVLHGDGTWQPEAEGLPTGGTAGQLLAKESDTNYDVTWVDQAPAASYTSVLKHTVKAGENLIKGQAVYVSSADGTNMVVSKASNTTEATSSKTMGLIAQNLSTNGKGFVITEGLLAGLDTGSTVAGAPVWLGTNGNLIYGLVGKPYAPAHLVFIGIVTRANNSNGEIFVKVQNGFELDELHDVDLKSILPTDGQVLQFDGASGLWKNKTLATGLTVGSTAISSGTDGRVLFQNGGVLQQSSNLFWDNTNGRLGVGTITPTAKLEVNGEILTKSSNPLFTLRDSDNDINAMYLGADFNFSAGTISYTSLSVNRNPANGVFFNTARAGAQINLESSNNNGTIGFYTSNLNNTTPSLSMVINQLGYVGIGQIPPTARLDVRAQGALSTDIAFRVRNSANTGDWFSVQGDNITNVVRLISSQSITIAQPAGFYYPTLGFSNNGGASQGSIYGYNSRLVLSSSRIAVGSVFSINFGNFDANYAQLEVKAKDALSTSNSFGILDSALSMYFFKVQNNGSIGIGTTAAIVSSAKVQIDSTTQGFLPPRMTNAQRLLISTPAVGLMVYCTDVVEGLYIYKSTGWTFVI
jgi:hypothetical protein